MARKRKIPTRLTNTRTTLNLSVGNRAPKSPSSARSGKGKRTTSGR